MTEFIWLMVIAGGPVLLAIAIIYVRLRQRRFGPAEQARQDEATRELYRSDQ